MKATSALTNSLIAVLVLLVAGCAGPPPEQSPPPPMASADTSASAPDLAGAPPEAQPAEAQSAPAPAPKDYSAQMAPVPNPEDLPPGDRARIYGHRYDQEALRQAEPSAPAIGARPGHASALRHAHTTAPAAAAPAYTTHVWGWRDHAATARGLRHRPGRDVTAGQPHQAGAALKPSLGVASTPTVAAAKPTETAPSTQIDRLAQLQSDLSGPVADGSGFVVADDLTAGKPGAVSLSLPSDIYNRVRSEAAKVGLAKSARRFTITATLSGDGYAISPITGQTMQAPLAEAPIGPVPSFSWQVQPQAGAGGPLKTMVIASLTGDGAPQTLQLLSLERPVKPAQAADQQPADATDPFNLHLGAVDMRGLGKIPVSSILAVILLILVVVILVSAARHTAERDREERRKARAAARTALLREEAASARADVIHPPPSAPLAATSRSERNRTPEPV
ncbi:MAG TPA: hypothetical protein VGI79_08715 [Caulobacteraceae bacterium]|jgi:hypothetical protein